MPEPGIQERVKTLVLQRAEAFMLGALLVATLVWGMTGLGGRTVPGEIYMFGVFEGMGLVLHAAGLVIVYRSSRVINFAQLQLGALAGMTFMHLTTQRLFVQLTNNVCDFCVRDAKTVGDVVGRLPPDASAALLEAAGGNRAARLDGITLPEDLTMGFVQAAMAPDWLVRMNYWLAALVAVSITVLVVGLVYALTIRKFNEAPRVVLTVGTLAAGWAAVRIGNMVFGLVFGGGEALPGGAAREVGTSAERLFRFTSPDPLGPVGIDVQIGNTAFGTSQFMVLIIAVVAIGALAMFLRRSGTGIALRGASENPDRAQTLGISISGITARAWLAAGLLSGLAAVFGGGSSTDDLGIVKILAAAVIGGFASLPLAIAGALVIPIAGHSVLWVTGSQDVLPMLLLIVIVVLLLVQRSRSTRAELSATETWSSVREVRPIPQELRHLPVVRRVVRVTILLGVLWVLSYPWVMSPSQTNLGSVTMILAMVGLSLLILAGWAGQLSLGHMSFAAVGAWTVGVLGWPLPMALVAGTIVGAVVAAAVGLPALRLRGLQLAVATFAFAVATSAILLNPRYLGEALPTSIERPLFLGINLEDERAFYYLTLVALIGVVIATMGLRRSRIGRVLIGTRENEALVQSVGVNVVRARLTAFVMSGAVAAFAGGLFAYSQRAVDAQSFEPDQSISVFLFTVIGGFGSVAGPILGAMLGGALTIGRGTIFSQLSALFANEGLLALVTLAFAPGGLTHIVFGVRDKWLRRLASRHRIVVPGLVADRKGKDSGVLMLPNMRPGGGEVFVPNRFRLHHQWMLDSRLEALREEEAAHRV